MNDENYSKKVKFIINTFYIAIILIIIWLITKYALPVILPFIIAFSLCYITEPLNKFMISKFKLKRASACAISIILLFFVIGGLFWVLSVTIFSEGKTLIMNLPEYFKNVPQYLDKFTYKYPFLLKIFPSGASNAITNFFKNFDYSALIQGDIGKGILGYAKGFVVSIPSMFVFILMTIVSTFFMSISFDKVKMFIIRQFPKKYQTMILDIKHHFFATLSKYGRSYLILITLTFVELSIFFTIFRIKPSITLALIISIIDILPVLGVGTVLIPWAVIEFIIGNTRMAVILLSIYIIVTIIRQIAEPKIVGDNIGLMPIATLFCIYVGLKLFGFLGMFFVPISVIIIKNMQDMGHFKIYK